MLGGLSWGGDRECALSHFKKVITMLCYLECNGRFVKGQWGTLEIKPAH